MTSAPIVRHLFLARPRGGMTWNGGLAPALDSMSQVAELPTIT